jgi:hypothetical protein
MLREQNDYWLLLGKYGKGKSRFASQMAPEYLVLDLDGRWEEQNRNVLGKYHVISDSDVLGIDRALGVQRGGKTGGVQRRVQPVEIDAFAHEIRAGTPRFDPCVALQATRRS